MLTNKQTTTPILRAHVHGIPVKYGLPTVCQAWEKDRGCWEELQVRNTRSQSQRAGWTLRRSGVRLELKVQAPSEAHLVTPQGPRCRTGERGTRRAFAVPQANLLLRHSGEADSG